MGTAAWILRTNFTHKHWSLVCFPRVVVGRKSDIFAYFSPLGQTTRLGWIYADAELALSPTEPDPLAEPDHHSLHVFGRSPVLHQEVDHAF